MTTIRYWNSFILLVLLLFFANIPFAEEILTDKLKILINHQFHLNANHKFIFYDFPIKDKEHIVKSEQEITIKDFISNKSGNFYEVSLSNEQYHYYIDALLFYSQVDKDYTNNLYEKEMLRLQKEKARQEEETRQQEEDKLKQEELEKQRKASMRNLIKSKIGDNLPPNYKGDDFQKVYSRFFKTIFGKNEFEKTADYKKKMQAINQNEIYAFQIAEKDSLQIEYDADEEMLRVKIDAIYVTEITPITKFIDFIVLTTKNKKASSYVGQNAFGAKTLIKKHEGDKYGVRIVSNSQSSYSISLGLSPNEAKKQKNNISALIICKPYIADDTLAFVGGYYNEATFSNPIEISYTASGINIELLEIWLYNFKTGGILHKMSFWE